MKNRSGPEYIFKRGKTGVWYARLRVPTDLIDAFGKDEFRKSLGTTDERAERKLGRQIVAEWERQFNEARVRPDLKTEDFETLARAHYTA